jgi:hypothetical protein
MAYLGIIISVISVMTVMGACSKSKSSSSSAYDSLDDNTRRELLKAVNQEVANRLAQYTTRFNSEYSYWGDTRRGRCLAGMLVLIKQIKYQDLMVLVSSYDTFEAAMKQIDSQLN